MICLHWVALKKGLLTGASKSTNANTCMHYCGGYVFFVLFSRKFENKMVTFPRAMKNEYLLTFAKAMQSYYFAQS